MIDQYRIFIMGDSGVGKTALTTRMAQERFVEGYEASNEVLCRKQCSVDGWPAMLDIIDRPDEVSTALNEQYSGDGECFFLVYSVIDRQSFDNLERYREHILKFRESKDVTMIIVSNKCEYTDEREIGVEESHQLASKFGCSIIATSPKEDLNVKRAFHEAVRQIREKNKPACLPKGGVGARDEDVAAFAHLW